MLRLTSWFIPIAFLCLCAGKVQGQTVWIKQELTRLPLLKDSTDIVNSLNKVGVFYYMKDPDSCFYYAFRAKSIAIRIGYSKGMIAADNIIGTALYTKGLSQEALELFSKTLKTCRQSGDSLTSALVLTGMAGVYHVISDIPKAITLSRQAVQEAEKIKQDSAMSVIYVNYCIYNPQLGEDSIHYYLNKARAIATRYKDEQQLILIMQAEADYLLRNGHKQGVLPLIRESMHRSRNAQMEYLQINALWLLGDYYQDKPDSILTYYHLTYDLIMKTGYDLMKIPILNVILKYTEMSGNQAAIIKIHKLLEAAFALQNENLKKFIGDYVKYNAIQDENRLLEVSNKNNRAKIVLLITVCCVISLLIIFIYRQYRLTRRLLQKISEKNSQMQKALSSLEQSQADNTRMMKIVAHDLRSPIGAMTAFAGLLKNEKNSPEDEEMLHMIKISGENCLELVDYLLTIPTHAGELKKEPVAMNQLLQYCVDLLQLKAGKKQQQICLQATAVTLQVNREKIWRVVSNLIDNAIKFSPNGAAIFVSLSKKPEAVIIAVKDEGIGIPAGMKEKLFDMFTDAKRTGTAGEQSFGLGLAISKQIVEAHGGRVSYESEPRKGTTFFVELPLTIQHIDKLN